MGKPIQWDEFGQAWDANGLYVVCVCGLRNESGIPEHDCPYSNYPDDYELKSI